MSGLELGVFYTIPCVRIFEFESSVFYVSGDLARTFMPIRGVGVAVSV